MRASTSPVDASAEIRKTVNLLFKPGQVLELRVPGTSKGTQGGYFSDAQKLEEAALRLNRQGPAVYVTINPVDPTLVARANNRTRAYVKQGEGTSDKDILSRQTFPIDFDAVQPTGVSTTDEEHDAAILRAMQCRWWLAERGWPAPILADSGNGGHLTYRVDLPNDEASTKLLEKCLKALGAELDDEQVTVDPTTFNASRLWKLYGTEVRKGDALPDRPHRTARIIEAPKQLELVPLELLQQLVEMAPTPKQPGPRAKDGNGSVPYGRGDYSTLDVVRWFQAREHYGRDLGGGKHSVLCPWVDEHTDQRSPEDSDTVIWEATDGQWPGLHCSHAHCKGRDLKDVIGLWGDADSFCSREFRAGGGEHRGGGDKHHPDETAESAWLTWHTAREIMELTPTRPDWVAEHYLARETLTELDGKVKVGKTQWVMTMVKAITTGNPFLGGPTQKIPVVYLTEERSPSFASVLRRVGLDNTEDMHVLLRQDARHMTWPDVVAAAVAKAKEVDAGALFVDTLSDWAEIKGEGENITGLAYESMAPLQRVAEAGLAVLVVRHDRKSGGEISDSARGSSAFSGVADIVLGLQRANTPGHPSRRVLKADKPSHS